MRSLKKYATYRKSLRSGILTAVSIAYTIFWYGEVLACYLPGLIFDPVDECSMVLQNKGKILSDYATSQPIGQ
jgi:hypothetical protein